MRIIYFLPLVLAGGFNFAASVFAQSAAPTGDLLDDGAELKTVMKQSVKRNSRLCKPRNLARADASKSAITQQTGARETDWSRLPITAKPSGFSLAFADGSYQVHAGGWIQSDGRFYSTDTKPNGPTFLVRRARPYLEATLARYCDFRLMADFSQRKTIIEDAFGDIGYWNTLGIRAGKFKEPVGLERLQNDRYLMFAERALTVNLVPDRNVGITVHGGLFDQKVAYDFGIFNAAPDDAATAASRSHGKEFAGRVVVNPFADSLHALASKLAFGIAATYGSQRTDGLDTYKTAGQTTFFSYNRGVAAAGERIRLAPQLNYYLGPFGFQSEFVKNAQRLVGFTRANDASGGSRMVINRAWQVAGSYLLTGEDAEYAAPIEPHHPFNPPGGGFGAWEIVMRADELDIDSDAFRYGLANPAVSSSRAFEWMFGINWYPIRSVKMQLDYERTGFAGGAPGGRDRGSECAVLSELQVAF
jgi:phosphate-selective porin OprO/OprP